MLRVEFECQKDETDETQVEDFVARKTYISGRPGHFENLVY